MNNKANHRQQLINLYTQLAEKPDQDFGWSKGKQNALALAYESDWMQRLPDAVWESAAAVGNPFQIAPIQTGESVLDLGCGAGADACVAALLVGVNGTVVGIDCTPAMVNKARANAHLSQLNNVTIKTADFIDLPVDSNSFDVVISNGAINLSQDKNKVFDEIYRVLKPGGRLQLADMIRQSNASNTTQACSEESWADCVQGTLSLDELLAVTKQSGFSQVKKIRSTGYKTAENTIGVLISALKPG